VSTWFAGNDGEGETHNVEEEDEDTKVHGAGPSHQEEEAPAGLVMGGGRTLAGGSAPTASSSSSGQPASTGRSAAAPPPPPRGGLRTLKDLQGEGGHAGHGHANDDDDDSADDQDFFAGGEKSGLAVQNPNAGATPRDQINSILDRARRYVHGVRKARNRLLIATPEEYHDPVARATKNLHNLASLDAASLSVAMTPPAK
jgi:UBX domain-containing protein 1